MVDRDSSDPLRLRPRTDIPAFIRAWVLSEALADLTLWEAPLQLPDRSLSTTDLLAWLDDLSVVWDYRGGRERNEATDLFFERDRRERIDRATRALGLQDTDPPERSHYDHVVILGGLSRGCLARPLHAAALVRGGTITANCITALGALRPLNEAEEPMLALVGLEGARTEFDVMDFGVRQAFNLSQSAAASGGGRADDGSTWRVHRYSPDTGPAIQVAAAPSPVSARRASTGETYEWLANTQGVFSRGESVLVVTTYHYRLYQLADAIRLLGIPHGLELDAVGIAPGEIDARLEWAPSTGAMLQEVRSSIRSLRQLHEAATGHGGSGQQGP